MTTAPKDIAALVVRELRSTPRYVFNEEEAEIARATERAANLIEALVKEREDHLAAELEWGRVSEHQQAQLADARGQESMALHLYGDTKADLAAARVTIGRHEAALKGLIEYADLMPKGTPAAGACSTMHQFSISAGAIWGLDERVKAARQALSGSGD